MYHIWDGTYHLLSGVCVYATSEGKSSTAYTVDAFQYLCGLVSLRLFLSVIFLMEYASVASICPCQVSVGLNRLEKLCVTDMFILLVPTYGVVNLLVPH